MVTVYVGSHKFDHKDQTYPPHGSVPAKAVAHKSGKTFSLTGTVYAGKKDTVRFYLACKIA